MNEIIADIEKAEEKIKEKIIKTGVSRAYWLNYKKEFDCQTPNCEKGTEKSCKKCKISEIEPALNKFDSKYKNQIISWLDVLFDGGIKITESAKPLVFLLNGPPGGGKSTFLLDLCYNLAINKQDDNSIYSSLFVTLDTKGKPLIEVAHKYGWEKAGKVFFNYSKEKSEIFKSLIQTRQKFDKDLGIVTLLDKENLDFSKHRRKSILKYIGFGLDIAIKAISGISSGGLFRELFNNLPDNKSHEDINEQIERLKPKIIVIDSLNIIKKQQQEFFFNKLINSTRKSKNKDVDLIILVVDDNYEKNSYFDYVADIVVRLDYTSENNYFIRNFEIIKTRYQNHVLGKHYLKINPKFDKLDNQYNSLCDINIRNQRAHPYRIEGGFFVIPSIHFYLSKYRKLSAPLPQKRIEPYPSALNRLFKLPYGRCTSFIGSRGTHRSHLAYIQLLNNLIKKECAGLIISLRADEKLTKDTLQKIYEDEFNILDFQEKFDATEGKIDHFINNNLLEILHFLPGYITPNEFFHRIFVNACRLQDKNPNKNLIVVFNSLEQLAPRFPLCAKEDLFISSIIDFFHGLGITAIFIGVDNPAQPIEGYGLLPLSDLIISFYNHKRHDENGSDHYETLIKVVKNSGGISAGEKGVLGLDNKINFEYIPKNTDEGERLPTI